MAAVFEVWPAAHAAAPMLRKAHQRLQY